MKRIGILGDIGSGKTYVAKCFGFPVFVADLEVEKIYKNNKKVFFKLKKNFLYILTLFQLKKRKSLMQFYLISKI